MAEMGLFEAIYSARSLRRFKPDPVPDEVLAKVLDAAIRAPTGSNSQNWVFLVVKDAAKRKKIGEIYSRGGQILSSVYASRQMPAHMNEKQQARLMASAMHLFAHMGEVPVQLFLGLKNPPPAPPPPGITPEMQTAMRAMVRMGGSSIYPAVQNVMLACRAFGLGTVLTTIHVFFEDEIKAILDLPADVQTYALMPIGYPTDKFGPVTRMPITEVTFLDSYKTPWKVKP